MRSIFTLLALIPLLSFAQFTPLQSGDMETWVMFSGTIFGQNYTYEEPDTSLWTTTNGIVNLGGPSQTPTTTEKTTDAFQGNFAAKMVTKSGFGGTLIAGIVAIGEFDPNANPGENLKTGKPFTARPDNFAGAYKFTPENGDSASIIFFSWKWNSTTNSRDTIGGATIGMLKAETLNWTTFDLPISYASADMPDSMTVICSSSAGGAQFQGQVGNTLFVDDLKLQYASGATEPLMAETRLNVYPNPSTDLLTIETDLEGPATAIIYDITGKIAGEYELNKALTIDVDQLNPGTYLVNVIQEGNVTASRRFTVLHP